MDKIVIPEYALGLWRNLEKGMVVVHEQELGKASDIKFLFQAGLIRFVAPTGEMLSPSCGVVLSEQGIAFMKSSI